MIMILNSLLDRWLISTSLSSSGVLFVPSFGKYSSITLCLILLFISMYWVGQLHFSTSEKGPYGGDVLWNSAACSPLVTTATCLRGALHVVCVRLCVVMRPTPAGVLVGGASPWPG